jgi:hypothetical protein
MSSGDALAPLGGGGINTTIKDRYKPCDIIAYLSTWHSDMQKEKLSAR